uniref:Uncharacterized protein n=1 Tax=Amphimedon queenslandica TaxID=400682 RepID=A0A1X7TNI6_AMPQE
MKKRLCGVKAFSETTHPAPFLILFLYEWSLLALRSGKEHRLLQYSPYQIKIIKKEGQIPYLEYSEEISKNNPGGLKGRK